MPSTSELAYAKVNLFLGITERRDDGFHEISSVMHSVSCADRLTVSLERSSLPEIKLSVLSNPSIPCDQRNLVWRAIDAYMRYTGCKASVSAVLEKTIPSEAGLGGGSSDAAAALRAMERLVGGGLTHRELSSLAAELGSDVPFCLFGGTALCTGRGERLLRLSGAPSLSLVICKGSESVSTPAAYRALDLLYRDFKHPELLPAQSAEPMARLCRAGDAEAVAASLYNVFEDAVYPVCPEAMEQRSRLLALGARGALLSGSGSAVFGIFDSPDAADEAASAFGRIAFSVRSAPESIPFAE